MGLIDFADRKSMILKRQGGIDEPRTVSAEQGEKGGGQENPENTGRGDRSDGSGGLKKARLVTHTRRSNELETKNAKERSGGGHEKRGKRC